VIGEKVIGYRESGGEPSRGRGIARQVYRPFNRRLPEMTQSGIFTQRLFTSRSDEARF